MSQCRVPHRRTDCRRMRPSIAPPFKSNPRTNKFCVPCERLSAAIDSRYGPVTALNQHGEAFSHLIIVEPPEDQAAQSAEIPLAECTYRRLWPSCRALTPVWRDAGTQRPISDP